MIDHLGYLPVIDRESRRFLACLEAIEPDLPVPSCPEWTGADLLWHLTEVQHFWGSVVAGRLQDPDDVRGLQRPGAYPDLLELFEDSSRGLSEALGAARPEEGVWTWSDDRTVAFVLRRQAHEALIHRVDAELVSGRSVRTADPDLAMDGIDELLEVMVGSPPEWGSFQADGALVGIEVTDLPGAWTLALGRFRGTSPTTGKTHDLEAAGVRQGMDGYDLLIRGRAWLLDRWLWGRAGEESPAIDGDQTLVGRVRTLITEATR